MCKNGWSGPEYNHLDRGQHGKLEDSVDIKPGGTWDSRHQKKNLSRRLIIAMSLILRDTGAGYQLQQGCKINHLH